MEYAIKNEELAVTVAALGGELTSMTGRDGTQYLWQPDEAYWKKQAPHLFPVVGKLTGGRYSLDGESYQTDTHGFFRWRPMTMDSQTAGALTLSMDSDGETLAQYPRQWRVQLTYRLEGRTLHITFAVRNRDTQPLFFAYGGHPGFCLPLEDGLAFEDYALVFEAGAHPQEVVMTPQGFVQGTAKPLPLGPDGALPLRHSLFDNDVLVLKQAGHSLILQSAKGKRCVTVAFPQMPYVGLWHAPKTDAPYVCVEPWTALPARQDVVTALDGDKDMICLAPGDEYRNDWSITFG